jgi:hypothetical protein
LRKFAIQARALGNPETRDDAPFDPLAGLSVAPTGHDGDQDSDSSAVLSFEVSDCAFSDQLDISR